MTRTQPVTLCSCVTFVSCESRSPGRSSHPPPRDIFAPKTHPHAFPAVNCSKYFYMKGLKFSNVLLEKAWGHNKGQKGAMCDSTERSRHLVEPSRYNQHARSSQYSTFLFEVHFSDPSPSSPEFSLCQINTAFTTCLFGYSRLQLIHVLTDSSQGEFMINFYWLLLVLPLYVLSPSASSLTSYGNQSFSVSVFETLPISHW